MASETTMVRSRRRSRGWCREARPSVVGRRGDGGDTPKARLAASRNHLCNTLILGV
jgi:hypothetical protein